MSRLIRQIFLILLLTMASNIQIKGEVALHVVEKYRHDPVERFRLLYKTDLRPFQWEWFFLMKDNPYCLGFAAPHTGKGGRWENIACRRAR